jgi:predicted amidohydrolase
MALSGFSMDKAATTWDAADFDFFAGLARGRGAWVTAGGVENGRNTAFAFDPDGRIAARYAKRHLFSHAGEGASYEAGNDRTAYVAAGVRVAQAICYDLRFPYHFWDDAPAVDAFCVIAAWGAPRATHWNALLRARAIENQAFVVGVNRCGSEPSTAYAGGSAVYDPRGAALLECGGDEGAFAAEFDPREAARWRSDFAAMRDRRE